ncbi:MAG: transcription-repair coupling factor, partial [Hyphomonadaceae bacterium]
MTQTSALPQAALDALAGASSPLTISGAPEGLDAFALAQATLKRGGVTVFVARDETRASGFDAAVKFFAKDLQTLRLPAWDSLPYDRISPAPAVAAQRCAALAQLAQRKSSEGPLLVITTAGAIAQRVPPRTRIMEAAFAAHPGEQSSMEELERYFVVNGYARASTVRAPGDFAIRG